jgi:S1-C subfamily serine protease
MHIFRRIHLRIALLVLVGLVAVGVGAALAATRRTTAQIGTGVVVINTNLAYQGAAAAGTGMVLRSGGEILTNNHVIKGATTITVRVPGTSRTYTAHVIGYDAADDVAVLRLANASNLKTVTASTAKLVVGQTVRAVGNAGGTGRIVSATGRITGLAKAITVADDNGAPARLSGLIETNAALQPGDSGGPLLNTAGRVIGMDTAASQSTPFANYSADGYAIPIAKALSIVKQVESGHSTARVHVGGTAFLGVQVEDGPSGVTIAGLVSNGPAAQAGLATGDVITAIGGTDVTSSASIQKAILARTPGAKVSVTYLDDLGTHTVTVTLGSGPAQ